MPSIKQNPEQQKALEDVTTALAELKNMNALAQGTWSGGATLSFNNGGTGRGSTIKIQIDCGSKDDEKDIAAVLRIVQSRRARIAREALNRAAKYDIRLDEEEEATLRGELPQKKSRKKQAEEQPVAQEPTTQEQQPTAGGPEAFVPAYPQGMNVGEQQQAETQPAVSQSEPVPENDASSFDASAFADDGAEAEDGNEDAELAKALNQYNQF